LALRYLDITYHAATPPQPSSFRPKVEEGPKKRKLLCNEIPKRRLVDAGRGEPCEKARTFFSPKEASYFIDCSTLSF
jgi:hypothetical protein